MNSDPKVTVLVPIFNVEPYLRQCLGGLRAQTLLELEVLLLDDGSTDDCSTICDEYAAQDVCFRVIHKANIGYGATTKLGLREKPPRRRNFPTLAVNYRTLIPVHD